MTVLRAAIRKFTFLASTIVVGAVIWFFVEQLHAGYGWPAVTGFYFGMLAIED